MNVNTSKLAVHAKTSKFLWDRQVLVKGAVEGRDVESMVMKYQKDARFSDHGECAGSVINGERMAGWAGIKKIHHPFGGRLWKAVGLGLMDTFRIS